MPAIRLAIDASGGDYAPDEIIAGAIAGAQPQPGELVLVGRAEQIEEYLQKFDVHELSIEIVDAPETIEMGEDPALAVRKKRNASIVVACELVRDGHADAVISMGHTGAGMVAALLTFGRLPGIDRPAAIAPYLGFAGTYLLDVGLNTEVQPQNLLQFAIMGSVYAEKVGGIARPRVALLANGTEPRKGNAIGKQAYELLAHSGLNFIGNVEGLDLPRGTANVVVSDGFTMNVALKTSEGVIAELLQQIDAEIGTDDARATAALARLRDRHDYARVGAAPLLGVNSLIFIGHGRSKAPAVVSAIEAARRAVENRLLDALREGLNAT